MALVLRCGCGRTVRPYLPKWRRMSIRRWGGEYVFLCDSTMLPSHVKDYYPFKGLVAQGGVVQSVAGRDVRCTLYHLDQTLESVMSLGRLLSLTLPLAAKIVRELENSAASLGGFRLFATDHQELTIDEALRTWKHMNKQKVALLNTTLSTGVNRVQAKGNEETIGLPTHTSNSNPHLRDLGEELPGWCRGTQTQIDTLQTVRVADIVGSAAGSGWQFLPDWTPIEPDTRFEQLLQSIKERGFDPAFDGSPIELIEFQDEYWVADGHRRVSAAVMLGIGYVRAEITLLTFTSPPQLKTRIETGSTKTTEVT